ncbi:MAG TPA: ribonuclease J [Thermomicrobiales bacterium]|nr:ribonuclease J [Thermomicrobiales bacterium]
MRRPRRDDEAPDRVEPRLNQPRSRGQGRGKGAAAQAGHSVIGPIGTDTLRVIPLGGVGEIGKNMTAVECGRDIVLLDCGGKFPEEEQRGIDLIVPDISFITERLKNFRGILLTHGHEDHIGGLPHIIPQIKSKAPIPIYGTPLALGFAERKLIEARLEKFVEFHTVESGDRVQLGSNFTAEFVHVTHSIPDACAIALHTPVGTVVDTGDFKFDPTPVMGGPTDERRLRRIGENGVLALFSDTTRVEVEGTTPSEKVVQETIDEVIGKAKGQVIIATFASNVSRLHMALHAAAKHGRKVAAAGRSMEQNARVALELGYLDPPEGLFVSLEEVLRMPKEKRVIVCTGSQGEVSAALARIAAGEHPKIRVGRGDTIVVSATPIPGNEDTVSHTINNLFRLGADVIYSALNRKVHVSGHAAREELERMIKLLKPKYAVPIHGEYRHMALYRDLCIETGIPRDHVFLPEIGGVLEFTAKGANQRARVKAGNVLVDRLGDRGDGQTVLRTRENLTDDGLVIVTMVLDRQSGDLIAGPELVGKGLPKELHNGALREAERELRRMLERRKEGAPQYGYVVQRAKETVGKALYRRSRTRPLILPVVTEL